MKLWIESTRTMTELDGIPVRLWRGQTEGGAPVLLAVHRLIVEDGNDAELTAELVAFTEPAELHRRPLVNVLALPWRMLA